MSSLFNTLYHGTPADISDTLERLSREVVDRPELLAACLAGLAKNQEQLAERLAALEVRL